MAPYPGPFNRLVGRMARDHDSTAPDACSPREEPVPWTLPAWTSDASKYARENCQNYFEFQAGAILMEAYG